MTDKTAEQVECATVSVEEAGRRLGLGRNAAYAAAKRGEIPSLRIGGRILVPREALDRMAPEGDGRLVILPPTPRHSFHNDSDVGRSSMSSTNTRMAADPVDEGAFIPVLNPVAEFRAPRRRDRIWPWSRFYDYERRLHQQRVALEDLGVEVNALRAEAHEMRLERPEGRLKATVLDQRALIGELNEAVRQATRVAKARAEQLRRAGIEPCYETEAQRERRDRALERPR